MMSTSTGRSIALDNADVTRPSNLGLGSWPRRRARISPTAVALSQGARTLTYAQLADTTDRLASGLSRLGVRRGDRVAYLGLNDISTFEVMFATGSLGAVFVPLNYRLSPTEISYMLEDSGARILFVGTGVDELALSVCGASSTHELSVRIDRSPADSEHGPTAVPHADGWLDYEALLSGTAPAPAVAVGLDDPALFLYTSGTTGRPKAAVLTHGSLTWNTFNQLAHLDVLSTDRALCISPLFHAVGLGQVTLPVLYKGGQVEVVPRFDAADVLGMVERLRIASFSCVPTMLQMMVEDPAWASTDLSSLRHVVYGGSPVVERVAVAWWERGVQLQQGYGMTEAGPGVAMAPAEGARKRPVSVGVPHFFTDVALLDENDSPCDFEAGDHGELLVRGPHLFVGYWGRADDTAAAMVGDGSWYRTGDVLISDDDGWFSVIDRVKDLIISGGENVYPAEIEAILTTLPGVRSAAVVARPDERWGEVGVAFVERSSGATVSADAVLAHLTPRLAKFKLPRQIVVVDDLPRTATGKVLRTQLREDARHLKGEDNDH
jgi:fatty-acyl-CoA synthase